MGALKKAEARKIIPFLPCLTRYGLDELRMHAPSLPIVVALVAYPVGTSLVGAKHASPQRPSYTPSWSAGLSPPLRYGPSPPFTERLAERTP